MYKQLTGLRADSAWKIPNLPGVYLIYDGEELLYVGKSTDLRQRFLQHSKSSHNLELKAVNKDKFLLFSFQLFFTEVDLANAEKHLIRALKPKFNKLRYVLNHQRLTTQKEN